MIQLSTKSYFVLIAIAAVACNKTGGDNTAASAAPSASAAPKPACDGLYVDPNKEFCLKLPAGFTAGEMKTGKPGDLDEETIHFKGPSDTFAVHLGFQSSAHKTFDDDLAGEEKSFADKPGSVVSSGAAESTGKWWVYKGFNDQPAIEAYVKSKANKTLTCEGSTSAAIDACKSLRVYSQ